MALQHAILPAASRAAACARVGGRIFSSSRTAAPTSNAVIRGFASSSRTRVQLEGSRRSSRAAARRLFVTSAAVKEPDTAADAPAQLAWRAAIDYKKIRDNAEAVQLNADNRAASVDVAQVVELYEKYQTLKSQADEIREKRNLNAKSMKGKMEAEQREALIEEGKSLKDELATVEVDLNALEVQMQTEAGWRRALN